MATPKTNECPSPDQLRGLLSGALAAGDQEALTRHIEACPSCQHTLDGWLSSPSIEGLAASAGGETATQEAALRDLMEVVKKKSVGDATQAEPAETNDGKLNYLEPSEKPGTLGRLKNYEIREILGKGGFGTVFKALDTKLQRMVAIKVLAPGFAANGSARKRFVREAQAAAAVKNEHVVAIYNVEDEHQPPYIVMEIIDGISLQDRLDKSGSLELKEILRIGMQIAEGLAAAHKQGLIHRDIKPANILLENGVQRVKITDFGLARLGDDASITQSGVIAGTPMYMAPEQAIGEKLDQRADLFSLGSLLYALCTGRGPFRAANTMAVLKRVCEETPRPIREINPEIPDWLEAIIAKLHAKKPDERHQSAREVADVFSEKLAELQSNGRANGGRAEGYKAPIGASATVAPATGSPKSRRLMVAGVLLALAVSMIAAAVNYWPRDGENVVVAPPTQAQATGDPVLNDAVLVMNFEKDTFYEKDGKTYVRDLSGKGNDGLCEKVAFTPDGKAGGGLLCQGGRLLLPKSFINRQPNYTITFWCQCDKPKPGGTAMFWTALKERPDESCFMIALPPERLVHVNAWNAKLLPDYWKNAWNDAREVPNGWFFIAVSLEGGGTDKGKLRIVIDDQIHFRESQMVATSTNHVDMIGIHMNETVIDELAIFQRVLSEKEIAAIRARGLKGIPLASDNLSPRPKTVDDAWIKRVGAMPAVEQVDAVKAKLKDLNPGFDGDVKHKIEGGVVTELRFVTDKVTNISPIRVFNALRVLDCSGTVLDGQGNGQLADLSALKGMNLADLVELNLKWTGVGDAWMVHFKDCKNLTNLYLNGTQVSDMGLAHFKDCKNLTWLQLVGKQVNDVGLAHFKDCKNLKELGLGNTQVSNAGLAYFKDCKNMTILYLNGTTQVGDVGLAHFKDCKQLTHLALNGTQVSDAGLAGLKDCKKLTWIFLNDAKVGDAGVAHLKDCIGLTILGLAGTQVSDDGLTGFKSCKNLTQLDLRNTKITAAKIAELKKALPDCKIEWDEVPPAPPAPPADNQKLQDTRDRPPAKDDQGLTVQGAGSIRTEGMSVR